MDELPTLPDIFRFKDKNLADFYLSDSDILAKEIIENMEALMASFKEIMVTINEIVNND